MIRPLHAAFIAAAASAICAPAHAETRFLSTFDDVPLAPGLTERADAAFAFAAPEGRIAEATAAGAAEEGAVLAYYRAALPALGWSVGGDGGEISFVRGRERLTLTATRGSDGTLTVRYRIITRPASLALD